MSVVDGRPENPSGKIQTVTLSEDEVDVDPERETVASRSTASSRSADRDAIPDRESDGRLSLPVIARPGQRSPVNRYTDPYQSAELGDSFPDPYWRPRGVIR